jgi:diguanylate cyclase (GGDEF)-like protein
MSRPTLIEVQAKNVERQILTPIRQLSILLVLVFVFEALTLLLVFLPGQLERWEVFVLEAGLLSILLVLAYVWLSIGPMKRKIVEENSAHDRLQAIMNSAFDGQLVVDDEGTILYANEAAENMLCYAEALLPGQIFGLPLVTDKYSEIELLHKGVQVAVEMHVRIIQWAKLEASLVTLHDISERRAADEKMQHMANYDDLTNLANRKLFYDRMKQEVKRAQRSELKIALLFIDLDHFKQVNDTLGHGIGDLLLVEAAIRMGDCVRAADTLARLGGDEFTVILPDLVDTIGLERITLDILNKLAQPFQLDNTTVHVSGSIGIVLYPDDATDIEELMKSADQAMYMAKKSGRGNFYMFGTEQDPVVTNEQPATIKGEYRE